MDCKKLDIKNLASIELYCVIAKKKINQTPNTSPGRGICQTAGVLGSIFL